MGEFDDVLAMEPGDEWDAATGAGIDEHPPLPELRACLDAPGVRVELRGEVSDAVLAELAPWAELPPAEDPGEPDLDDELARDRMVVAPLVITCDGDAWSIEGPAGGHVADGHGTADLVGEVWHQADRIVLDSDVGRVHLAATCVERGGDGIVVIADPAQDSAAVGAALVEAGASWVTQRLLSVLPGSHTVFGYRAPAAGEGGIGAEEPFRAHTVADVVVHLRSGDALRVEQLGVAEGSLRLLHAVSDRERFGPAVLDVAASTAGNATHWVVTAPDAASAAAAIAELAPPERREFCVLHRFDDPAGSGLRDHTSPALRVARFDDGAVALDARSGSAIDLTPDELDALEETLLGGADRRDAASVTARLERLVDAGMYVPAPRRRAAVPGPEAFGLPNCPSGEAARSAWRSHHDAVNADAGLDGATALAVLRGVLPVDEHGHAAAAEAHRQAQEHVVDVERRLIAALTVLDAAGIDPIVLGSVVHAHDGPLPPYFAESEQIDLLVRDGELARAVEALEASGCTRVAPHPEADLDGVGVVDLSGPENGRAPIRVRDTLAVGPFGALVDHDEFQRRAVPVRIHRRWCRSLHPEHRFVHACVQVVAEEPASTTQHVRDVVLAAPRADALMAEAMEASERWGATATVTAAVRRVDGLVPGLSPWIVQRSTRPDAMPAPRRRRRSRRRRSPGAERH